MLIVVTGLPGSGKSTLADALGRQLPAAVVSVDVVEAAILRQGLEPSFQTGVTAYEVAASLAAHQLRLGSTVVVDAVSAEEAARTGWRSAADTTCAALAVILLTCGDESLHRRRLAARRRDLPGLSEPTWIDVERRSREWEPWPEEHLVLDSVHPLKANLQAALRFLADRFVGQA